MRTLCHREGLLGAFGVVGGVVPARSPHPGLANDTPIFAPDHAPAAGGSDPDVPVWRDVTAETGEAARQAHRFTLIAKTFLPSGDGNKVTTR